MRVYKCIIYSLTKNYMVNFKIPKTKKGVSEIFIATSICIFVILGVTFVSIVDLKPFFINLRLQEVTRQAILRMETDGGLSSQTKDYINNALDKQNGFELNKLQITPSCASNEYSFANYGHPIKLTLTYNYIPKKYSLIGYTKISKQNDKVLPIKVSMETTSKRIKIIEH